MNHYFNIIFKNNKRIKLHKFNIGDLKDFLVNIENRLYDLNDEADPNNPKNNKENIIYKTDPETNDLINKLMAENAYLRDLLNNYKKPRFDPEELDCEHIESFQFPEVEDVDNDINEYDIGKRKRKIKGKVKKIDPKNLHDKYSGHEKPIFHANGWAADAFKSVFEDIGNKKKLVSHHVTEKLKLHTKQIIPVKKKTFAFFFNKPRKQHDDIFETPEGFIREDVKIPAEKHSFH